MIFRKAKMLLATVAFGGALTLATAFSSATPQPLNGVDANGNTISSGWTWDTATPELVNLVFIRAEGSNFFFEKDATITRVSDPIVITFNRVSTTASTLVINDETIQNNTGVDWEAFRMELSSGSTGGGTPNFAFMSHDGSPGIGDFNIDPFAQFTFYSNNSGLLLNGGSAVKAGSTWYPGANSDTGLAIVANTSTVSTFTLKEFAVPATIIPLPAAAWTGMSTLLGLGFLGAAKKFRSYLT